MVDEKEKRSENHFGVLLLQKKIRFARFFFHYGVLVLLKRSV